MEFLDLNSFDIKWTSRIKEFMVITVAGKESSVFDFVGDGTHIFKDSNVVNESNNNDKSIEEINELSSEMKEKEEDSTKEKEIRELIEQRKSGRLGYFSSDGIRKAQDKILGMEPDISLSSDIKSFSAKEFDLDFKLDINKFKNEYFSEFFREFSKIKLESFKESDEQRRLPESAYIKELFSVTSSNSLKDYVFYLLNFKVDCVEYRVMKSFLMMCYLFQFITNSGNYPLTITLKRLSNFKEREKRLNLASLYLRLSMLLPKSGTIFTIDNKLR